MTRDGDSSQRTNIHMGDRVSGGGISPSTWRVLAILAGICGPAGGVATARLVPTATEQNTRDKFEALAVKIEHLSGALDVTNAKLDAAQRALEKHSGR